MTDRDQEHEHLQALGQPPEGTDTLPEPDFASEHEETAVADDIRALDRHDAAGALRLGVGAEDLALIQTWTVSLVLLGS